MSRRLLLVGVLLVIAAIPAVLLGALPFGSPNSVSPKGKWASTTKFPSDDNGPKLYEAANRLANTNFISNAELDPFFVNGTPATSSGDTTVVLISRSADAIDTLGYFGDAGSGPIGGTLFSNISGTGWFGPPYPAATFSSDAGDPTGWYFGHDTDGDGVVDETWQSDGLYWDGLDQLSGYYLGDVGPLAVRHAGNENVVDFSDAYLIGFGAAGGGGDYDDLIVLVGSEQPIPEPSTFFLFALGVAGTLVARRRGRSMGRLRHAKWATVSG